MDLQEYKTREFKGDGLVAFISALVVCDNPKKRDIQRNQVFSIRANKNLEECGILLGLEPHPMDIAFDHPIKGPKTFANAYEVKLFDIYEAKGLDAAIHFFKETAITNYFKKPIDSRIKEFLSRFPAKTS
jgi:hypothetical protein